MADIKLFIELSDIFNQIEDKESALELLMTQVVTEEKSPVGTKTVSHPRLMTAVDYLISIGVDTRHARGLGYAVAHYCKANGIKLQHKRAGAYLYPVDVLKDVCDAQGYGWV